MAPKTLSPGTQRRCRSKTWGSSSDVQVRLHASETHAPAAAPSAAPFRPACIGSRGGASAKKAINEAHASPSPTCPSEGASGSVTCEDGALAAMARSKSATGPTSTLSRSCSNGGPNMPPFRTTAAVVRTAAQIPGKTKANHGSRAAPP